MTYCEFCGEQISYLPFNCKYCGGTFCKKHRLPENHQCTFELKHVPVVPTTSKEPKKRYQDVTVKKPTTQEYLTKGPRALKKYLKRQEKQRRQAMRSVESYRGVPQYNYTKILFGLIIVFSITAMFFPISIAHYIFFSLPGLIYYYTYHTFFTALFVSSGDFIGLFFLFIMLFFLYFMARNIELNYGWKFLIKLYVICCLFSALFYILLRLALVYYAPLNVSVMKFGLAWGGIYGLISYSIFPLMNREITALMTFIPLRMRGRSFLLMIILIRLLPGLFFALIYNDPIYLLYFLPELGGILGAYIIYKYQFKRI
ncbi:MAG: AN1-type zinc finger domain-containing protein [Promethearchaeota archaeon]